ncbi:uncharacterized protein LOC142979401 [Anticarsia gemmatalis]|uniref:uncharacterized protein LOC142979401 n=1 Tax=Anticarsia gemmatalis TaxID=129554 RepID=UPI003F761013
MTLKLALLLIGAYICASSAYVLERCVCPKINEPVCGSNGVTYPSLCALQCDVSKTGKIIVDSYKGECLTVCRNTNIMLLDYGPLCGSDGKTYDNKCALTHATVDNPRLKVVHGGRCRSFSKKIGVKAF